jgi:hypothetical protein
MYSDIIHTWHKHKKYKFFVLIFNILFFIFLINVSFAADKTPRYQIVTGNDEKAYLLDTTSGFTWILTYRTMATGREPVAIPFKFIKISPQNQKNFILESNGTNLPSNGMP